MSRDETPDTHPTPDASPDPAVVTPDAGDVEENLLADIADYVHIASTHPATGVCHGDNDGCGGGPLQIDCEIADDIFDRLASHVAAAREADRAEVERLHALADTHREVAESMSAKWQEELDRADRLEAMCDRLAGDRVDREDAAEARAKAVEERLAGLVAKIEALADECATAADRYTNSHLVQRAIDLRRHARDLRALIPADAATALDAVREKVKAEERERIAQAIEVRADACNRTARHHGHHHALGLAARIARHTPEATS